MPNKTLERLINVPCPLNKALPKLRKGSARYSDQLSAEILDNKSLGSKWFFTRDFPMYEIVGKEPVLELSRINPGFENAEEFCGQIGKTGNYAVSKKDAQRVRKSKTTTKIPLSKLDLIKNNDEWCYFDIDTSKDGRQLNDFQRPLAERAYGSMEKSTVSRKNCDFDEFMKLLKTKGISVTRFFTLSPEYVLEHAKDGPIARVCRHDYFNGSSCFDAGDGDVDSNYVLLRGVPLGAEGASAKISRPNLGEILKFSKNYVPKLVWKEYESGMKDKFRK